MICGGVLGEYLIARGIVAGDGELMVLYVMTNV